MHNFSEYYYVRHYNTYYYWTWSHEHNYNYNSYGPLSIEDTKHVWSELDPDNRGYCEIEVLLTWLNEYANW